MPSVKGKNNGGKRPGAGRKSKAQEMGLRALLDECITDAERKELFRSLYEQGKKGNVQAASLVLGYIYGKPKEQVEHEGELTVKVVRVPAKVNPKEWQQSRKS